MKINKGDPPPFAAPNTQGTVEVHFGKWTDPFEVGVSMPTETCFADPFLLHGPYTDAAHTCKKCKSRKHRFDPPPGPRIPWLLVEQRRKLWRYVTMLAGELASELVGKAPWDWWSTPEFQALRGLVEGHEVQVINLVTSRCDFGPQIAHDFVTNSYVLIGGLLRAQFGIAQKRPALTIVR